MNEINPDFIARMASQIYNERSQMTGTSHGTSHDGMRHAAGHEGHGSTSSHDPSRERMPLYADSRSGSNGLHHPSHGASSDYGTHHFDPSHSVSQHQPLPALPTPETTSGNLHPSAGHSYNQSNFPQSSSEAKALFRSIPFTTTPLTTSSAGHSQPGIPGFSAMPSVPGGAGMPYGTSASFPMMPHAPPMLGGTPSPVPSSLPFTMPFSGPSALLGMTPSGMSFPFGAAHAPSGQSGKAGETASGPAPAAHANIAPSPTSSADLSAFIHKIRESHLPHRDGRETLSPHLGDHERRAARAAAAPTGSRPLDVDAIRRDFPILRQHIHGRPIVWFDNAATTQKPQSVIDAISRFYENDNSNIHRAAHTLAARATDAYEQSRQKIQMFLGASSVNEIAFVRGTTEGINLIAQTFGRKFLKPGDEIILSQLEHHASIVPWQMIAKEKGALLRVIPVNDRGEIMLEEYQKLLGPRTKVLAITHASNSLGTILPVHEMTQMAKRYGARVIVDGAQSVAHIPVNVQQLGCDFFVFSGHKIFGPTGIGAVYINQELHDVLPPWQGGGNMIRDVTFEETSYHGAPARFEAGTPNIADAVGLGTALDYVNRLGLQNIAAYEHHLLQYATERLSAIDGLRLIGTARDKVGVLSFVLPNKRTEEIGRLLDQEGIAVRAGHHCSQPSLRRFSVETTVRPSLSFYNTTGEVDRLADAIRRIRLSL